MKGVRTEDSFEFVLSDLLGVAPDTPENAENFRAFAVLLWRNLFEVFERPIENVPVDVVDVHAGCTRSDKGLVDEMMAVTTVEISHRRVGLAVRYGRVLIAPHHGRGEGGFEFATFRVVELAVG